jgi:hypothetical protein
VHLRDIIFIETRNGLLAWKTLNNVKKLGKRMTSDYTAF